MVDEVSVNAISVDDLPERARSWLGAHRHEAPRDYGAILHADQIRCQLFSEPGADSDLAGLSTTAELDGDEWVVNGQKVWCSNGRVADRGILLARTDPTAQPRAGISFFLDEMRLPADALLGPLHGGWGVAMATLTNKRGGSTPSPNRAPMRPTTPSRRIDSRSSWRVAGPSRPWDVGEGRSHRLPQALASSASRSSCSTPRRSKPTSRADAMLEGGTTQVQKNIIGERLLGLPKEPKG